MRLSELIAKPYTQVHRDIRRMRYAEYWFSGGRGSGKSSFIALEIVLGLLDDSNANAIVYRKFASTLRESVYEQILWAMNALGVSQRFIKKLQPLEIVYRPTGQKILFRGADNPEKSKSIMLAKGRFKFLWFEELNEFSGMDDMRSIKASIVRGGRTNVFASYNPPVSRTNWVNAEAARTVSERTVHHSTYLDLPEFWLGEGFLNDATLLKAENLRAYRHMYLGEATGSGAQVFENLTLRAISEAELDARERFYCGLDFGFAADPDAFVRIAFDPKRKSLLFADEFQGRHMPAEVLAENLKEHVKRGERIVCDSAEPRALYALRAMGLSAEAAKKGPGSLWRGMRFLQELAEIVIDPQRCPEAAREFSMCEYARDRAGNIVSAYQDRDNHFMDATRYALERFSANREAKTFRREDIGL